MRKNKKITLKHIDDKERNLLTKQRIFWKGTLLGNRQRNKDKSNIKTGDNTEEKTYFTEKKL